MLLWKLNVHARGQANENELRKSDYYFGERGGGGIGGLGNFAAAARHVIIWDVERRRAAFFAMAAFQHRKSAGDAAVSGQVHGVLDCVVTFLAFISELSG
jgi:hypothetical protein